MKKLLLVCLLPSGCAISVDGSDINMINEFCKDHGGVTELTVFAFDVVTCADGKWTSLDALSRQASK